MFGWESSVGNTRVMSTAMKSGMRWAVLLAAGAAVAYAQPRKQSIEAPKWLDDDGKELFNEIETLTPEVNSTFDILSFAFLLQGPLKDTFGPSRSILISCFWIPF